MPDRYRGECRIATAAGAESLPQREPSDGVAGAGSPPVAGPE
ncbi:hypothetical protein [Nocardia sp. CC227C]|nr:hypothetical protein [Nocardia sp. CC227C]